MSFVASTKSEETIHTNNKALPRGMGYKSCWMVVEGASQKAVMDAFLQGRKMKYTYEKGLEKIAKAGTKENKMLVTSTYQKQNYVIGTPVSEFFYETEEFLAKCRAFPRVYVYMTHRVSDTHGFALVEYGELVRFFKYDENEIVNIGQPLPEEITCGYHLPKTFADDRDQTGNFTIVDEDVVMELAICQVGIDVEKYPYKDIRVGKRFAYSAELAKDPYPGEDDMVTDEIRNLPVVQRFAAAKTDRERLDIFNKAGDELTHSALDAFGEIIDLCACYGRLSERIDEMHCILQTSAHYEEREMTREELLQEISRGNFIFEDKIFNHIVFEDISCEYLIFHKCTFRDSQFAEHQVWKLELNECILSHSTFSGTWQNTVLLLHNNFFTDCRIQNLEVLEASEPSEMIDCSFCDCEFSDIKIHAKATVSDGGFTDCKGDGIEIANIDVGKEPGQRTCSFQNCSVISRRHIDQ